jgi:hypothetical protein
MDVLQRHTWYGEPKELDDCFRLRKGARLAVCRVWTHQFGWELGLVINTELRRSQVCRSQEEVFSTGEEWKTAMVAKGWS